MTPNEFIPIDDFILRAILESFLALNNKET
jgi:hypothetical protein